MTKSKEVPEETLDYIREHLNYNPENGIVSWIKSPRYHGNVIGLEAGGIDAYGYRRIKCRGRNLKTHRIAWFLYYGVMPEDFIDHKNHNPLDNRIINLREADYISNGRNQRKYSSNTSGYSGVTWNKKLSKWRAQIKVSGKFIYLGYFEHIDEAIAARKAAEVKYGFYKNHGK